MRAMANGDTVINMEQLRPQVVEGINAGKYPYVDEIGKLVEQNERYCPIHP